MPIFEKMVCDSLNGTIRDYLADGGRSDDTNLEDKLHASAKRWLIQRPEYEEAPNYKAPNEALKAKYVVLKPSQNGYGGEEKHNGNVSNSSQGKLETGPRWC